MISGPPTAKQSTTPPPAIAILGTASAVGKTTIAAAINRVLSDAGYRVAPFKSQNMAANIVDIGGGKTISWAQKVQAQAARATPHTDMNPIVLRPISGLRSEVIIDGEYLDTEAASEWIRKVPDRFSVATKAYDRLAEQYDVIVLEGAGSAAEVNLWKTDIVNWNMVRYADAKVILVGDIAYGGIFAQLIGTMDLLPAADRARVAGVVVNRFRGDATLFDDGITFLEDATGVPVLGVIPTLEDLDWARDGDEASIARVATHIRTHMDLKPLWDVVGASPKNE